MTDAWEVKETEDVGFDGLTHSEVIVYVNELHPPDGRAVASLNLKEAGEYISILEAAIRKYVEEFTDLPVEEWEGTRSLEAGVGRLCAVLVEEPFNQILKARIQRSLDNGK